MWQRFDEECGLASIALEHVLPEGFHFLNVTALAVDRNTRQQEAFGEFTFKAQLLSIRACGFPRCIFAQPEGAGQTTNPAYSYI
jgi:hypothetical protein